MLSTVGEAVLGLGQPGDELNAIQMAARAVIVYVLTLAIIRLGKKRMMSGATAFDVIVGIVLGSIVSRAITGNAPFGPAMAAAATIVFMHWLFSALAVRFHWIGTAVKGHSRQLVNDGEIRWDQLRSAHMTEHDLYESMRESGVRDVAEVAEARLERSGSVTIIKRSGE